MFRDLISVDDLASLMEEDRPPADFLIVDCRADLADHAAGRRAFDAGHIPGAVHLNLETDLSGPPVTNKGRHPLPTNEALEALFSRLGVHRDSQLIAYDASGGAFAARFWWLARHAGVRAVAVLDGGVPAWEAAGKPLRTVEPTRVPTEFGPIEGIMPLVTVDELPSTGTLIDAREARRYRGEFEPIDPRAGHIPGALNRPFQQNLAEGGCFVKPEDLRESFLALLGQAPTAEVIHYCGSGVTACHNVLAQTIAGFPVPTLYGGSFSEWCRDPERVVATGEGDA